jgi:hypothetical protein
MQPLELFSLSSSTPAESFVHGRVVARGGAHATATFRRGIDLSAGVNFEARIGGEVGDQVGATFDAGVTARAGLAFQAAFPLDLFQEAGLVAQFQIQAELAAFAGARLRLGLDEFRHLVRGRVDGPLEQLLEVFFEEAVFEAGVWGRAAFAAEIIGEAMLTGSLLPSATGGPGFTFSFGFGAGLGFRAGAQLVANIGFNDPRRMTARLADELTEIALAEARHHLGPAPPPAAATALSILRTLLPVAAKAAFQLGLDLAAAPVNDQRRRSIDSVAESFVRQAQEILLESIADLAASLLGEALGRDAFIVRVLEDEERREQVVNLLLELRDRVAELDSLSPASIEQWLTGILALLDPIDEVLRLGFLPPDLTEDIEHALALLWCAGRLVHRVTTWAVDPARGVGDLFGSLVVPLPQAGSVAAYVAKKRNKAPGALTLADLAQFLAGLDDLEGELRRLLPGVGEAFDWIAEVIGVSATDIAFQLLTVFTSPTPQAADRMIATMGPTLEKAIRERVIPHVLGPLKAANPNDKALALLVDELVTPTLVALPLAVLPAIAHLGSPEAGLRFRETLSGVILQSLQRLVMSSLDVVLEHALRQADQGLREVADALGEVGERSPAFNALALAASHAVLPIAILPADARDLLVLSADVVRKLNEVARGPVIAAAGGVLDLGLGSEQSRQLALRTLSGTDDPPERGDLQEVLDEIGDGAWEIARLAVPRGLALIGLHYVRAAEALALAIYERRQGDRGGGGTRRRMARAADRRPAPGARAGDPPGGGDRGRDRRTGSRARRASPWARGRRSSTAPSMSCDGCWTPRLRFSRASPGGCRRG